MTEKQIKANKKRLKLLVQRLARKARVQLRTDKRKARKAIKAAPRNNLKAWSLSVRARAGNCCEVCGVADGAPVLLPDGSPKMTKGTPAKLERIATKRGKVKVLKARAAILPRPVKVILNSHHILDKFKFPEFKLLSLNGVLCCTGHHKYFKLSFHGAPLWFALWLVQHRPESYEWAVSIIRNLADNHLEVSFCGDDFPEDYFA